MNRATLRLVLAAGTGLLFGLAPAAGAPALKDPRGPDDKDAAIYLGCGEVGGPGTVVQLDRAGNVLGTVALPGTPYGLAVDKAGLVAAIPTHGAGKVVRITRAGKVETLLEDQKALPAPIAVAADPATGDLLVADNVTDVLLLLPAGKAKEARPLVTIDGHKGHCQDMSVAFTKDGHVLFGGTGPVGVYRFPNEKGAAFGAPVLKERGDVAADPASKRWAAAQADRLHVYDADREVAELKYPDGRRMWMGGLAFTPGGTPVLALHLGGNRFEVMTADVEAKEFKPLFAWGQSRVTSLAVGRRAAWKD